MLRPVSSVSLVCSVVDIGLSTMEDTADAEEPHPIKKARPKPCLLQSNPTTCLRTLHYFQVVLHAEHAEDLVGPDAGDLLVHRRGNRTVEAQVAVIHHNPDRLGRIAGVATQHRVTVDRAHGADPNTVVEP